jgi:hypothetical protein
MITEKFLYKIPHETGDEVIDEHVQLLYDQWLEWNDKLERKHLSTGYAHAMYTVIRTDGGNINQVPRGVLINAADGFCYNFGGRVTYEPGQATVKVNTD